MPCPEVPIQQIFGTECIGDSLPKINNNFTALGDATCGLITKVTNLSASPFNIVDSPTVDLSWNSSTRTLSADASYLLTLIKTLSTNMQNIGNYPYLEYATVTAPISAGQQIPANTLTTLTLDSELADTGNFGTLASNQITLSAGTYTYKINSRMWRGNGIYSSGSNAASVLGLYKISPSTGWISRGGSSDGEYDSVYHDLEGQFTISTITTFEIKVITNMVMYVYNGMYFYGFGSTTDTKDNQTDQRTTIKLWKVG